MKKILMAVFLLTSLLLACQAYAAEMTVDSKITHVTVYQDRALITRSGAITLEKGQNFILFDNLPSALVEESLRADGKGSAGISILGVELKKIFSAEEVTPSVRKIQKELEALRDELSDLQEKTKALSSQRELLDSIKNFSSVQIPKEIATKSSLPAEWGGLSSFLFDQYTENGSAALALQRAIREKNREIEAKQQELQDIRKPKDTEKKTVIVTLDAKESSLFNINLHYLIHQATWHLSYDAKVSTDKKVCTLISYANIRQWSGEDWKEVLLTLSSAKPAIGGKMPELSPWHLDFMMLYPMEEAMGRTNMMREKKPMVAGARPSSGALDVGVAFNESLADEKEHFEAAVMQQAVVSQQMGSVTYEATKPATVLADNRLYKTPVKSDDFQVDLDYETTPKLSPYAFMHSKVTNDKDYTIVGGDLNVFVNNNYLGRSSIKTVGQKESFDLYLGIDEAIKVKRTELLDKKKQMLLGLRTRKDFAYKFELENYKKEAIKLTMIDQLPLSKNSDIKAELISASIKPTEKKDLGILKWRFDLAPKEKKELQLEFFVEYPSDKSVSGL